MSNVALLLAAPRNEDEPSPLHFAAPRNEDEDEEDLTATPLTRERGTQRTQRRINRETQIWGYRGRMPHTAPDFDGNSGAPIFDPARFCWNLNTCRAGSRFANPSFARKQLRRTGAIQDRGRSSQLCPGKPALRGSGGGARLQAKHFLELAFDLLLSFPTDGALDRVKPRFGK